MAGWLDVVGRWMGGRLGRWVAGWLGVVGRKQKIKICFLFSCLPKAASAVRLREASVAVAICSGAFGEKAAIATHTGSL